MDGKKKLQCRLWWPCHLTFSPSLYPYLLFGWASQSSHSSLDLVVATTVCSTLVFDCGASNQIFQVMLNSVTKKLPSELQEQVKFSIIGECIFFPAETDYKGKTKSKHQGNEELEEGLCSGEKPGCSKEVHGYTFSNEKSRKKTSGNSLNGQFKGLNGFPEVECIDSYRNGAEPVWAELCIQPQSQLKSPSKWVPEMHKLRFQGHCCSPDVHLVLYEQPILGSHHYSIRPWSFISQHGPPQQPFVGHEMNAEWITNLKMHRNSSDIDLVILQLNCAFVVERTVKHSVASLDRHCKRPLIGSILTPLFCHIVAAMIAVLATFYYIIVQAGYNFFNIWPFIHVHTLLAKLLKLTYRNVRIRFHELTGWPVVVLWRGWHDQPNIAAAHRAALIRHSIWSAVVFDLFIGVFVGALLLWYQYEIHHYIRTIVRSLTDDVLRTGCIWLMGVPAGFKLNTELAGTLGLISLNMIQVWSTLLYFLKPVMGPGICILAISGMLFGITVPAAIIADIIFLATFHISVLHQLVAFLYSNQLQALAALWRLFRGRKKNTLRGRIDTFDYSVEQHVVGSLMFTPLLLLLPTTSVFYIFFTMLYTSLSIVRFSLQIFIAILHCFPYAQVALWLVRPRRFPSGIWFEILSVEEKPCNLLKQSLQEGGDTPIQNLRSHLGIRSASIGDLLLPYMKHLGGGLTWSSSALCIYKIFSGERWPSSVELGAPVLPPWIDIPVNRFWWISYYAVLSSIYDAR